MITADILKTSSYSEIIEEAKINLKKLSSLHIKVPEDSWFYEALSHAEDTEEQRVLGNLEKYTSDPSIAWKTTIAFGNLSEANLIIRKIDTLLETSEQVVRRKLNDVVRMPLRMLDESSDAGTNLGRNTLFELRLATRLASAGYSPILYAKHPDILIPTDGFDYPIECKRVFSSKSFENLSYEAIRQLEERSLNDRNRLGIVAVSITRHFHKGDKKLYAESSEKIGEFADKETERFVKEKLPSVFRKFPINIPCLILDFSDLAESDRPYWAHWLYLIETTNNNDSSKYVYIQRDLNKLLVNQNE